MSDDQDIPRINVKRHEHYRDINVNGIFGGQRPGFIEAIIHTDEISADESLKYLPSDPKKTYIERILQCRLIIDPIQAKRILVWLAGHIKTYEELYGKIRLPEESIQNNSKKRIKYRRARK